jgi:hypothetical protein
MVRAPSTLVGSMLALREGIPHCRMAGEDRATPLLHCLSA